MYHHFCSTTRKVDLSRRSISAATAAVTALPSSHLQSVAANACSFSPKRVFSEWALPMTNPYRNARVTSGPLEPKASTGLAATPSPQKKRTNCKPQSEYNLEDLMKNTIVQADAALIDEIKKLAKSEDDPPLIFIWDSKILGVFLQNMVQVPADVAIPPPQLQPAVLAGIGMGDDSSEKVLTQCIMDYL
jgi:hypothetical protein